MSSLVVRNVVLAGRRSSMKLEPAFWDALRTVAATDHGGDVNGAIASAASRQPAVSRASAVRVHVLEWYRHRAARDHLNAKVK